MREHNTAVQPARHRDPVSPPVKKKKKKVEAVLYICSNTLVFPTIYKKLAVSREGNWEAGERTTFVSFINITHGKKSTPQCNVVSQKRKRALVGNW